MREVGDTKTGAPKWIRIWIAIGGVIILCPIAFNVIMFLRSVSRYGYEGDLIVWLLSTLLFLIPSLVLVGILGVILRSTARQDARPLETSAEEQPGEERWTDEEIAEVPEDVRSAFERIEKDEYDQPGVFLVAQMKEAKSPFVRAQAIVLLAKKRPTNLLNIASEGLSDKDSRVREAAAQALATSMHIGAFSGLPIFKTLLLAARDDEDEKVRYWVEKCLARL